MKNYRVPTIALLGFSAVIALATVKNVDRTRRTAGDLTAENQSLDQARRNLQDTQRAAAEAKKRGAPIESFLSTWSGQVEAGADIERVFSQLDTLAVDNLLSPSGKNFTTNANYIFHGSKMPVQIINITVAGDFYRTLNWLGAVEYALPTARTEQISYTSSNGSLSLAVQLVFPKKFQAE